MGRAAVNSGRLQCGCSGPAPRPGRGRPPSGAAKPFTVQRKQHVQLGAVYTTHHCRLHAFHSTAQQQQQHSCSPCHYPAAPHSAAQPQQHTCTPGLASTSSSAPWHADSERETCSAGCDDCESVGPSRTCQEVWHADFCTQPAWHHSQRGITATIPSVPGIHYGRACRSGGAGNANNRNTGVDQSHLPRS